MAKVDRPVYPINPELYPFGVQPEPNYTYAYFYSPCNECDGCFDTANCPYLPEGWEPILAPILTDAGWAVLVRRPQSLPGGTAGWGAHEQDVQFAARIAMVCRVCGSSINYLIDKEHLEVKCPICGYSHEFWWE